MTEAGDPVAIIRRLMTAMEQADDATLRALYAPDHIDHFHWHAPGLYPGVRSSLSLTVTNNLTPTIAATFPTVASRSRSSLPVATAS